MTLTVNKWSNVPFRRDFCPEGFSASDAGRSEVNYRDYSQRCMCDVFAFYFYFYRTCLIYLRYIYTNGHVLTLLRCTVSIARGQSAPQYIVRGIHIYIQEKTLAGAGRPIFCPISPLLYQVQYTTCFLPIYTAVGGCCHARKHENPLLIL